MSVISPSSTCRERVRFRQTGGLALEEEIRAFIAEDYGKVVAAVALLTGSPEGAEDAVQESLLKALRDGHRPHNLAAWVTVVATNEVRQAQRRRRTEERVVTPGANRDNHSMERLAEAADVRSAISGLPPRQRQIVLLHYYLDAGVADIAQAMGISTGTVKTQLHRARHTLAGALGVEEGP